MSRWTSLILVLATFIGATICRAEVTPASTAPADVAQPAAVIVLRGEVDDYNRDQLFRQFEKARAAGAKTVVLEIDTYGGLVTAGLDISRFIKRQSPEVRTVAYV